MSEALAFVWAFAAGGLLGGVFFGGLWWTVQRAACAQHPALWFLGSLLLRTVTTLAGFYLVGAGHWQRLALCVAGFVMTQLIVTSRTGRTTGEARGAP